MAQEEANESGVVVGQERNSKTLVSMVVHAA